MTADDSTQAAHRAIEAVWRLESARIIAGLTGLLRDVGLAEELAQDAMLLGRVTYEMFAAHWPNQTGDMADTMNGTPKYVVSGTLESVDWQNSTLIPAASAFTEIAELKQQPGQNIGMTGSGTLVSSLLREGLLDELHLFVFPLVAGSGKRLFAAADAQLPLKLLDSATFQSGVVHLTYAKA